MLGFGRRIDKSGRTNFCNYYFFDKRREMKLKLAPLYIIFPEITLNRLGQLKRVMKFTTIMVV